LIIDRADSELGGIDILVNNAAHQASFKDIVDISDEEWELTFKVNIHSMFYLIKAAMRPPSRRLHPARGPRSDATTAPRWTSSTARSGNRS
jgi:NAD(P)-dependent dehydrogenase (short-subunit alcohol dehydrogenase family)